MDHVKAFLADESGAITVDWIVLTASCVALGWLAVALFSGSAGDLAEEVNLLMSNYEVDHEFDAAEHVERQTTE